MHGKVISIVSRKGGVGKTTIAANLGTRLALNDKKVLVINTDLGLQNLDIAFGLERRCTYHLMDVLMGVCRWRQALIPVPEAKQLYILPASDHQQICLDFSVKLKSLIHTISQEFDAIIMDCPAGLGEICQSCMELSDTVLVIAIPDITSLHDASQVCGFYKQRCYNGSMMQLIINQLPRSQARSNTLTAQLEPLFPYPIAAACEYDRSVSRRLNHGNVIFPTGKRNAYAIDQMIQQIYCS